MMAIGNKAGSTASSQVSGNTKKKTKIITFTEKELHEGKTVTFTEKELQKDAEQKRKSFLKNIEHKLDVAIEFVEKFDKAMRKEFDLK